KVPIRDPLLATSLIIGPTAASLTLIVPIALSWIIYGTCRDREDRLSRIGYSRIGRLQGSSRQCPDCRSMLWTQPPDHFMAYLAVGMRWRGQTGFPAQHATPRPATFRQATFSIHLHSCVPLLSPVN